MEEKKTTFRQKRPKTQTIRISREEAQVAGDSCGKHSEQKRFVSYKDIFVRVGRKTHFPAENAFDGLPLVAHSIKVQIQTTTAARTMSPPVTLASKDQNPQTFTFIVCSRARI